ncbi:MAG TPA: EamA family transporter [Solirubrobacteraceae bacterium]|nr:EamA family transporter [Solirubrobacteraceae bacterium]
MWSALGIVYVLWGGTYVAIRVMVEDVPPLLGAGARFAIAGVAMLAFLAARGHRVRVAPRSLAAAGLVGLLLPAGGNGLVTVAERDVPAGLAALLIASVPLWLVLMRSTIGRERVHRGTLAGVAIGFCGLGLLLLPGSRPAEATAGGILLVLIAAGSWATGSFLSPRLSMPSDPLVSTGWQMVAGGGALLVGALASGEANDLHLSHASAKSLLAFAYLVLAGSLVAFTAYAWLLQNVPISKVATYAYVNPLVAVLLGWALLSEQLTVGTAAGAALIVVSVAAIVRRESAPPEDADPELAAVPAPEAIAEEERCIKQPAVVDSVS